MATIRFKGIDEYVEKLEKLSQHSVGPIKAAVWEGAHVVRGAMLSSLESVPVQDEFVPKGKIRQSITSEEKAGLLDGFGIAKMRVGNAVDTVIGFSGRNSRGESNSTIARQLESGTSWMQKNAFIRRAVNSSRGAAEKAIQTKLEESISKLMNGGI